MSEESRFNVYGRRVAIVRTRTGWEAFALGSDGKRGPLGIVVPDFIPFLGVMDDIVIVPFAIRWLLKRLPPGIASAPTSRGAAR